MACVRVIACGEDVNGITISPDGQLFAISDWLGGGVRLLDMRTGKTHTQQPFGINQDVISVAFTSAGACQPLLAAGVEDDIVRVWDCNNYVCVAELEIYSSSSVYGYFSSVYGVAFSPNGSLLASASGDGTVRLWRTDDWHAPPAVLLGHTDVVYGVSFSCDDRLLATCSWDQTVKLWRTSGTAAIAATARLALIVFCVAFSPVDNGLLAWGGQTASVVLARVDADTIIVERELHGHTDDIQSLSFSPCGRKLASTADDKTLRLWSVASGECLRVLQGHTNDVTYVAFFPNGKQLASCSWDKTVRIWTLCTWSDHNHHLFGAQLKHKVFLLMCVRAHMMATGVKPELPIELWLMVFEQMALEDDE